MYWLRMPEKIYFKKGCMPVAMDELSAVYGKKKAFIVTDTFLYKNKRISSVEEKLNGMHIQHFCYYKIDQTPYFCNIISGGEAMRLFEPDVIIAVGGGAVIDAAKLMRIMYEHPEADLRKLSVDHNDIRNRDKLFPKTGTKAMLVTIPTTSGTGSEVSPYAVFTDTDQEYVIADYTIMPDMAIFDADFMMDQPKDITASSGLTALVHAVSAYNSEIATKYTDGFALKALENILEYLPSAYDKGAKDLVAREKLSEASAMAGIAYANTYSSICGSEGAQYIADLMRINAMENEKSADRYYECAKALGIDGKDKTEAVKNLISSIKDVIQHCGYENKCCRCFD